MTKLYTFQSNSEGQHTHPPQVITLLTPEGNHGDSPGMRVHTDAVQGLHSSPSPTAHTSGMTIRPSCLRHDLGGQHPHATRAALTSLCGQPSSPTPALTLCRSSSAHRKQQETNHFPDPDLAACPGTGVPEPAQKGSQDDVTGKGGGGGGGWDQPHTVNISVGCQGASSQYGAAGHLSKSLDKVSAHT